MIVRVNIGISYNDSRSTGSHHSSPGLGCLGNYRLRCASILGGERGMMVEILTSYYIEYLGFGDVFHYVDIDKVFHSKTTCKRVPHGYHKERRHFTKFSIKARLTGEVCITTVLVIPVQGSHDPHRSSLS